MKRLCIVDSTYSLFLYYLICGFSEDDIFVFSDGIPESVRKNINHIFFPRYVYEEITWSDVKKGNVNVRNILRILNLRAKLFFKTFGREVEVYGHGHLKFSFPLYEHENSFIIEDGLSNYADLKTPHYNTSKILTFLGNVYTSYYESFGTHKNIKKIYLTKRNAPELIREKSEIIDMKSLWKSLSESEKEKILEIFNINDALNEMHDDSTLLLTQTFHEDNLMSLEDEIDLYRYLIDKNDNDVIIKTHPRERKDYSEIFPECPIIKEQFPLEILKCLDVRIKKIITVTSTAALNFDDVCEIEIYDKKTSSEIINSHIELFKEQLELQRKIR